MGELRVQIPDDAVGLRLDQWVGTHTSLSRSAFKNFVEKALVTFEGQPVKKAGMKIFAGGLLCVQEEQSVLKPVDMPLDIVYEDDTLLIVNKPRGLLVYPVKDLQEVTLVNGLLAHSKLSDLCGTTRPGIVHRIDKDTSGLVLVAKSNMVHEKLYAMLEKHEIIREYIGIACRPFEARQGKIDLPIAHDYAHGTKRCVVPQGGQPAVTYYSCVYQNSAYALMHFRLETGRTHQIRVHMSSLGHPLVGDGLYGDVRNPFGFHGQALHAVRLCFVHPLSGEMIDVRGAAPDMFKKAVKRIQMMK